MVSVVTPTGAVPKDLAPVVRGAVDLEVRRLLPGEDDPFGRAVLLWSVIENHQQLINQASLIAWGHDFANRVLVDGEHGPKRDETISAATLISSALLRAGILDNQESTNLRTAIKAVLERELQPGRIPFDRFGYGASILLACQQFDLHQDRFLQDRFLEVIDATAGRYLDEPRSARPFGLGFLALVLARSGQVGNLRRVFDYALDALETDGLDHEGRLYLAHAAWLAALNLGRDELVAISPFVEATLAALPTMAALEVGIMDLAADGAGREPGVVSRLYLATLNDLAAKYDGQNADIARRRIEARYQGSQGYRAFTFIGVTVTVAAVACLMIRFAWLNVLLSLRVYVGQQAHAASGRDLWFAPLVTVAVSYVAVMAISTILAAYNVLVRANVRSDAYLVERIRSAIATGCKWWSLVVVLGLFVGIVGNLSSGAIQSFLSQ